MDDWIPRKNIERYRKLLVAARSARESATLLSLIEVEQRKLVALGLPCPNGGRPSRTGTIVQVR